MDWPSDQTIEEAVALATRAPSVHNTQPWQWRYAAGTIELFADQRRRLALEDPFGRSLLVSCGAALHHFVVAMRARGWATHVRRLPDPRIPTLLATVTFTPKAASPRWVSWAEAIERRRSDRRPMSAWPVPPQLVAVLREAARDHGVVVEVLDNGVGVRLWNALATALAARQDANPAYQREVQTWTGVPPHSRSGVPAENLLAKTSSDSPPDRFPSGTLQSSEVEPNAPEPCPLLLTTSSDDPMSCLRAGEALSAILLEATARGLATRIDSRVVEDDSARQDFEDQLLEGTKSAQLMVWVGWPADDGDMPATPRRESSDVLKKQHVPTVGEGSGRLVVLSLDGEEGEQ